uniref:Uncharacterized protein n=1 Tax=Brassica oleracea TaxID=3712 RepID=A0A3P6EWH6_BRAOL|nr:unnamed protein product [Brassica oleracea]
MTLELRTIALIYDARMEFNFCWFYLCAPWWPLCRLSAILSLTAVCSLTVVCSPLTVFILALGAVCLYFSFWWQLIEKLIGILSWNMIVAGTDYRLSHVWSSLFFQYFLIYGVNWMNKRCWYCKDLPPSKCSPLHLVHVLSYGLH